MAKAMNAELSPNPMMQGNDPRMNNLNEPYLLITEQPKQRGLRFRYQCEGRSAGTILGQSSQDDSRTYPAIQICNFSGTSAIIVVSCVTKDDPPRPHPHSVMGKDCKDGVCTIKLKGSKTLTFPHLGIQCITKKLVMEALKTREKIRVDPFGVGYFTNVPTIDLNVVRLAFQCFLPDKNGKYTHIVPPVVSHCIYDRKAVSDLVICRLSRHVGKARGGDEIFMLTEKVSKDNIHIRFFEKAEDGAIKWEAYAEFGQQDVHRQYAIVFTTPAYHNVNITDSVEVFVQLVRPSDNEASDPKPFQYTPDDLDPHGIERMRKRKKMADYKSLLADVPHCTSPTNPPPSNLPATLYDDAQDSSKTLKQRIIKKAQRNRQRTEGTASSIYAATASIPSTSSAQPTVTEVNRMPAGMSSAAMDTFNSIVNQVNTSDMSSVDLSQFLTDTNSIALPSLPSYATTEQELQGGSTQMQNEQVLAAEVEIGGDVPLFSIETQKRIDEALDDFTQMR